MFYQNMHLKSFDPKVNVSFIRMRKSGIKSMAHVSDSNQELFEDGSSALGTASTYSDVHFLTFGDFLSWSSHSKLSWLSCHVP